MTNNISGNLLFKLHIVTGKIHRSQRFHRGGLELERGQGRVLRLLNKEDGMSQGELAKKVRISPASLSELMAKLEQKEHIIRKVDPSDKRVQKIYITEEGRKIAETTIKAREDVAEEVFSAFNDEEKKDFERLLDILIDSLEIEI